MTDTRGEERAERVWKGEGAELSLTLDAPLSHMTTLSGGVA
jgi:hypothetical protein